MKRTYQPNKRKRAKTHGFRARMATKGGRAVLARRRAKGRQASHCLAAIHTSRMKTIKSRQDFEHVFSQGRRFNHPLIRMTICESVGEGDSGRVAFVGAKRLGCAVVRNRSKRVMREAARSCGFPVAGYDIILFATPKTRVSSPQEMDKALRSLMKRAGVAGEER